MESKKINQLATEMSPAATDLTIVGDPITGVSKKITLEQIASLFAGSVSFYANLAAFPVTGSIDTIYCAKDTNKLYLWSGSAYVQTFPSQALLDTYQLRSEKGASNGYASLDSLGKVPIAQLPSSLMEYKGMWSAATNTPTLANGTGDTGDVYICNAAGSVNFGAGAITFAVGDYVIYSGSIWQRSSGAVGTVTSVAVTESGDSLNITGSPITTSGTINIGFNGTNLQYINGAGNLVTFPSIAAEAQRLITEVYNETGATLSKGTVVYINGGHGNLPTITKAIATGDATSAQTYGIVQTDITNNNNGYVVVIGSLTDLDTQAYIEGTQLYLSSTTAGAWTSVKQYAPAHLVYVAIVTRSHPAQGVVEVRIQNGFEMDELHNVSAQSPLNNQGLFYNTSTSLWENKSIATALGYTPADDSLVVKLAGTQTITGTKTFNATLYGTDSEFSGSVLSPIFSVINGTKVVNLQSLATLNRDIYLPDASGTLALTSDLSGYVTLAGTQTITGIKTFTAGNTNFVEGVFTGVSGTTAGALHLYQSSSPSFFGGPNYTDIWADTTNINFNIRYSSAALLKQPVLNFGSLTDNTTRTYTFPDASGTLALTSNLSSYVPYTGATATVNIGTNSFLSKDISIEGNGTYGGGINIKQYASSILSGAGYTALFATTGTLGILFGAGNSAIISGASLSANRTFTLPDASGTLALTSDLSSYVPYTGATTNVNLGVYGITANDYKSGAGWGLSLQSNSTIHYQGAGYVTLVSGADTELSLVFGTGARAIFTGVSISGTKTYTLPDASGTLALTSALSGMITGSGTTNYLPKFTGTSAIGNSLVYDNGTNVGIGTTSPAGKLHIAATTGTAAPGSIALAIRDAGNSAFGFDFNLEGVATGDLYLMRTLSGTQSTVLQIARATGAATFSSSVQATNMSIGIAPQTDKLFVYNASGTNTGITIQQDGTGDIFRANGNSGANRFNITQAGAATFSNTVAAKGYTGYRVDGGTGIEVNGGDLGASSYIAKFNDYSNNTKVAILGNGNVGIGTSSPNTTLDIRGEVSIGFNAARTAGTALVLTGATDNTSNVSIGTNTFGSGVSILFQNGGAERLRITSGGNVNINTTTGDGRVNVNFNANSESGIAYKETSGIANGAYCVFKNEGGTEIGTIKRISTTNAIAYNTTSDYRLKEDFKELNGLDKVSAIKVYDFKWKGNNERMDGVIAHELSEVLPYAVSGEKDAENMQSVDYSKLTPINTKAIQELYQLVLKQQKQIEELKQLIK